MKKLFLPSLYCILFLSFCSGKAFTQAEKQKHIIDSLHKAKSHTKDTSLYNIYINLSLAQRAFSLDSALFYSHKALKSFSGKSKLLKIRLTGNVAIHLEMTGNYDSSLIYLNKALKYCKGMEPCKPCGSLYNSLGIVDEKLGKLDDAAKSYLTALEIFEKMELVPGIMLVSNNLGIVYRIMGKYDKAKIHFQRVLDAGYETAGPGYPLALINMGACYGEEKKYEDGKKLVLEAIGILTKDFNPVHLHRAYITMSELHQREGNKSEAIKNLKKADELSIMVNNKEGILTVKLQLAELLMNEGRFPEAVEPLKECLILANELKLRKKQIESLYFILTNHFGYMKDEENLANFNRYLSLKDSLLNEENNKLVIEAEEKYESEKKEKENLLLKKNSEIDQANIKQQKFYTWTAIVGLGFLLVFSIFIWNRFTVTRRQKKIIEMQKHEVELQRKIVEEKNHEILDSINYARTLQEAILPPNKIVKEYLKDSFILYKPKDIVAGDFYFLEPVDEKIIFAAADCTGHGVPGAMVSVVCSNALNRSVKEFNLSDPGEILNKVRDLVVETFSKSESAVRDGMDISLCVLDLKKNKLSWSGANNPLWIIRNGANELMEIKPDKQPIGTYEDQQPFTSHVLDLFKGDLLYIFTDGYADQFGGEKGKKFKASSMKELFLQIRNENMDQQREIINQRFESWRGQLEQIDDVCVIGLRI